MDVGTLFVTDAEPAEFEQPTEDPFHDAPMDAQPTAMLCVSLGDQRSNAALAAVSLGYPKGRPYFGSRHQYSAAHSYHYCAPAYSVPIEDTRQSFSYEPTESEVIREPANETTDQAMKSDEAQSIDSGEQPTVRRSYSYEPEPQPSTMRARSGRRWNAVRDPWQYQKTDPRRLGR